MFVEILYRVRTYPKLLRWFAVLVLVVWLGTWHHSLHSSKQTYEGFTPLVREYIDQGFGHGRSTPSDTPQNFAPLTPRAEWYIPPSWNRPDRGCGQQ